MTETILYEVAEGVAIVTLNRPESRNAVNEEMCRGLLEALHAAEDDPEVRAILIRGAGQVFCAGADLKERRGQTEAWIKRRRILGLETYMAIEKVEKPVVALVHGSCVGSGCEIALASDFIIATENAGFRFPEPHWGTVGATQRLPRAVGKRLAKDLLYTNRILPANEAHAAGLVTRICANDDLTATGLAVAGEVVKASPIAISLTKQSVDLGLEAAIEQGVRIEYAAIRHNLAVGNWREGQERFAARKASAES